MKTKLTLFVTVITAALFGVGCASTQKTYDYSSLVQKDGIWKQESGELVTGKVINYIDSKEERIFHLKNGLMHGERRKWHTWTVDGKETFARGYLIEHIDTWENGVLIKRQNYFSDGRVGPIKEFNKDGSPKN
jgi:hypothetical protein